MPSYFFYEMVSYIKVIKPIGGYGVVLERLVSHFGMDDHPKAGHFG